MKAINYCLERLKNDFPLSLRLLKETYVILLSGGRGSNQTPEEFKRSQDLDGALLLLASNARSSYITGSCITVDGGKSFGTYWGS
jgi:NAD(P)-dependent dehydrogenase (short-subunit alcohol dehydrogenase family)